MGQEIDSSHFTEADFDRFSEQLHKETQLLKDFFQSSIFSHHDYKGGFELEGWLLDENNQVIPNNEHFLNSLQNPNIVPELAMFNFEVNGQPQVLQGKALEKMQEDMRATWQHCRSIANGESMRILMVGILPDLLEKDLCLKNMSQMTRYKALNRQVLKMRGYQPLHLHINGEDKLDVKHNDVMLEAASTSFQIHFQVPLSESVRHYNAAIICSAPMVAVSANSPFLFGKQLWHETRIPLFEQSVEVGMPNHRRVSFGQDYANESLFECFEENLRDYPILVPMNNTDDPNQLCHLRFHNGTIWRWNRPLIDFNKQGQPHLRIEHRVVPSGPTIVDNIANAALFFGLCHGLAKKEQALEHILPFQQASDNFYHCARNGLNANINWPSFDEMNVRDFMQAELLPIAREGLEDLNIDRDDINYYLGIIESRLITQQNGADWQLRWVKKHGKKMQALTTAYRQQQISKRPVHEWTI